MMHRSLAGAAELLLRAQQTQTHPEPRWDLLILNPFCLPPPRVETPKKPLIPVLHRCD